MKYFKLPSGEVVAIEDDGSQDYLITDEMSIVGEDELISMREPTREKVISEYVEAVGRFMDKVVKMRGYDSIVSACSYATSGVQRFREEAIACIKWRDLVWSSCYSALDLVNSGAIGAPSINDFIESLPNIAWPN